VNGPTLWYGWHGFEQRIISIVIIKFLY